MSYRKSKLKCVTKFCRNPRGHKRRICFRCKSRRQRGTAAYSLNIIRGRARKKKIEFSITITEFKDWCSKTGYLTLRGINPDSMTVGRINHDKGYHIWNIKPESHRFNSWKHHWIPPYLRI